MSRNYERLPIERFGRHLLLSGDLDPIYVALSRLDLGREQLCRWLVAYWCYYHAGVASFLSEFSGREFWSYMACAARNQEDQPTPFGARWPRGHERRHFRGANGVNSVEDLSRRYATAEDMVNYVTGLREPDSVALPFGAVTARAQAHVGFGPWIGFKIADMLDRVLGIPVDFSTDDVFMFKDPEQAALKLWNQRLGYPDTARPKDKAVAIKTVVDYLKQEFHSFRAPPALDRPVGLQEVETVLCKWKSHMNGHYPLWNDVHEIGEGLTPWFSCCETARKFSDAMPAYNAELVV